jgi:hypothetical protein
MGTWGVGVFDSDLAADLGTDVRDRLADGATVEAIVRGIVRSKVLDDPDDGLVVLLALVETLHDLGRPHTAMARRAQQALAGGASLEGWSKKDAKARAAELARLAKKLAGPVPRPKKLAPPKATETRLRVGDVVALELARGKRALLVVTRVQRIKRRSYPILTLFDWCAAKPPPRPVIERLPPRLGWREHDDERFAAMFAVFDMLQREGKGYEVVAHIAPPAWPEDRLSGESYTEVRGLARLVRDDLSPGLPHRPSFDPGAAPSAAEQRGMLRGRPRAARSRRRRAARGARSGRRARP